jgi:tripartite-type tricarboxylate transporter receptor subunit TctC
LPDVPTVGDTVPGYATNTWYGVGVPRGTPPEIVQKLSQVVAAGLANPRIRARLAEAATAPMPLSPVQFGALIAQETERWGKVIKSANIKPE